MNRSDRITALREAISAVTQILASRSIKVTQEGVNAYVSYDKKGIPDSVNIPMLPDDASDELVGAIRGFVDHEVGHLLFSDFPILAKGHALKVSGIHNALEDCFVERKMAERFMGSSVNLETLRSFFLIKHNLPHYEEALAADDRDAIFRTLFVPMCRSWAGQTEAQDYMEDKWSHVEDAVARIGESLIKRVAEIDSTQDSLDLAVDIKTALTKEEEKEEEPPPSDSKGDKDESDKPESDEPESDDRDPGDDMSDESEGGDSKRDSDKEAERSGTDDSESDEPESGESGDEGDSDGDSEGSDADTDEGSSSGEDSEGNDMGDTEKGESEKTSKGDASGDGESDESDDEGEQSGDGGSLDSKPFADDIDPADFSGSIASEISKSAAKAGKESEYLVFSKEEDFFDVWEPDGVDHLEVQNMESRVDHMVGTMQKNLERLVAARSASRWVPGQRRGQINAGALSRLALGAKSHHMNDDRVFKRREESKTLDTAVTLLVDCSGSMHGGRPSQKIEVALDSAYALASTLERLGVSNEVVGFTTRNMSSALSRRMMMDARSSGVTYARQERLYMPIFKKFDERMTPAVKARLAMARRNMSLENNLDGESLHEAAMELAKRREAGKFIIVISDGEPAAASHVCLDTDLKRRVRQVENEMGINVLGIGVLDDSVRDFYKKNLVINKVDELPKTIMGELRNIVDAR